MIGKIPTRGGRNLFIRRSSKLHPGSHSCTSIRSRGPGSNDARQSLVLGGLSTSPEFHLRVLEHWTVIPFTEAQLFALGAPNPMHGVISNVQYMGGWAVIGMPTTNESMLGGGMWAKAMERFIGIG